LGLGWSMGASGDFARETSTAARISVARMERSEMRGRPGPAVAPLQPGYGSAVQVQTWPSRAVHDPQSGQLQKNHL